MCSIRSSSKNRLVEKKTCSIGSFFKNRLDAKKQAGPTRLFFGIQAVKTSEFIERTLKNQSASIDAGGTACFFFVSEHPIKKKSGGLGVNKRNRG